MVESHHQSNTPKSLWNTVKFSMRSYNFEVVHLKDLLKAIWFSAVRP